MSFFSILLLRFFLAFSGSSVRDAFIGSAGDSDMIFMHSAAEGIGSSSLEFSSNLKQAFCDELSSYHEEEGEVKLKDKEYGDEE